MEGGKVLVHKQQVVRQQEDSIIHISMHTAVNSSPVFAKDQLLFRTSKHALFSQAGHMNPFYINYHPNT